MAKYCPYCASRVDQGDSCPYCNYASTYKSKPHHLKPGTLLRDNRYLVGRVLGEGGFGITYIGRDTTLDMKVAIKEYYPAAMAKRFNTVSSTVSLVDKTFDSAFKEGREEFIEEAQALADLDKESAVVTVRDFFGDNDSAYIVMEFVEGDNLKTIISKKQIPAPAPELLDLLEPVFSALQKAHDKGLIHRDISPDNIMIENGKARLIDFGCARTLNNGTATETVLKHSFSPIEQYENSNMGPWTDVYAMAATIYYCITGTLPPKAPDRAKKDDLVPPTSLGAKLTKKQERALLKALAVNPENRYQSIQEFGKDLFVHRNKYKYIAIAACTIAVFAAMALIFFKPKEIVQTMAAANTISEIYGKQDNLSAEERTVITQVESLIGGASLSVDAPYTLLSIENNTDYSFENTLFRLTFYDEEDAVLGTGSGSVGEWKTGESASPRIYCSTSPDHVKMRIVFDYNDKRYQTDNLLLDSFENDAKVTVSLLNKLPESFPVSGSSGKYTVAAFEYTVSSNGHSEYYMTYRLSGTYSGDEAKYPYGVIQYRLVNEKKELVDSGSISLPTLKDGERFANVTFSSFNIKAGTYTLELTSGNK